MSDLIRRIDAVQACQVGPSDEWSRSTKSGYNQAATDCAMNMLRVPAVQPVTEPNYCYDEAWEYTMPWGDRDTLVEWADLTKPVPIYTLIKGPTKWAVNIPLDTDGDGEADDFELTWFDTEDAALAALKGESHE